MDLNLTDEQIQFEDSFRKFCLREIAPKVEAAEQSGVASSTFEKLGSAGYLGLLHSECYGGQAASAVTAVLAQSILSYYCGSTFFSTGASAGLFALPIKYAGSDAQKEKYLPSIISGASIGCLAVTEAGAGSDVSALQTTLRPLPGGGYRLDGQKAYITNAPTADYALVLARLCRGPEIPKGPSSLTLCIVDLHGPGISRGKPLNKLGLRGSPTGELFFDGVEIAEESLLGRPGSGFRQTMQAFDWERLSMSAYCVGVMQACMDESRRYSRQRKAFGRIIAKHQSVAFMLADIK
ncbi:MAG: acyl-CoA/acyl-ACP dehydrogenase, partial [Leptospiraceae bacterium]|nr:acyl-CoA/acyl-ACP dehydrogenase [Leptospiraceae bacterium]